jgi:hypothetical protein
MSNPLLDIIKKAHEQKWCITLILVLRQDALNYPALIAEAKEYAKTSSQMRRVLYNAYNLNVPADHPKH